MDWNLVPKARAAGCLTNNPSAFSDSEREVISDYITVNCISVMAAEWLGPETEPGGGAAITIVRAAKGSVE